MSIQLKLSDIRPFWRATVFFVILIGYKKISKDKGKKRYKDEGEEKTMRARAHAHTFTSNFLAYLISSAQTHILLRENIFICHNISFIRFSMFSIGLILSCAFLLLLFFFFFFFRFNDGALRNEEENIKHKKTFHITKQHRLNEKEP